MTEYEGLEWPAVQTSAEEARVKWVQLHQKKATIWGRSKMKEWSKYTQSIRDEKRIVRQQKKKRTQKINSNSTKKNESTFLKRLQK